MISLSITTGCVKKQSYNMRRIYEISLSGIRYHGNGEPGRVLLRWISWMITTNREVNHG